MLERHSKNAAPGAGFTSILPFIFFIVVFFGMSIGVRDFYAIPVIVAFSLTAAFAFFLYRKRGLDENIKSFCVGAGDYNVVLMVLIFLLAGAFGSLAKELGSIDAVVNCCLQNLPSSAVVVGLFIVCCFISLSMGSSMGTVIALAPIAVGIAEGGGLSLPVVLGAVLGGAMFGDNLSSISDTTIAAVRTQGCELSDKFRQNFLIVLPAALVAMVIYSFCSVDTQSLSVQKLHGEADYELIKILPYLVVLLGALARVNVLGLLGFGVALTAGLGLYAGSFDLVALFKTVHRGMIEMEDLSVLSLIAAGTSQLIKDNGGLAYILRKILSLVKTRKGAELGISLLAVVTDVVTANNTVAIVVAGPIAHEVASKYQIPAKRSASLLDIFSSALQGIIPYGAQVLSAVSFAKISPLAVVGYNFYCYLTIIAGLVAIHFNLPDALFGKAKAVEAPRAEVAAAPQAPRASAKV